MAPYHVTVRQLIETWTPLIVNKTTWSDHIEQSNHHRRSSTVYIALSSQPLFTVQVIFESVNFTNNSATYTGICLNANTAYEPMIGDKRLILILRNVMAMNNTQSNGISSVLTNSSLFVFYRLERVFIDTTPLFVSKFDNNLGSVFDAFSTEVYLKGNIIFSRNNATEGPAILLRSSSFLVLSNNTHVLFKNNTAFLRGGAIYSVEEGTESNDCILQIDSNSRSIVNLKINLTFVNNLAFVAGNSIYIRPLQHCFQTKFHIFPRHLSDVYNQIFHFPATKNITQISSIPVSICKCFNDTPQCDKQFDLIDIYPGGIITVRLVAQDENNLRVQSQVNASFSQLNDVSPLPNWSLELKQEIRTLIGSACQTFKYTILSDLKGSREGRLNFAVPGKPTYTYVPIKLKDCPPGLTLIQGRCQCKTFLNNLGLRCNSTSMTITKPPDAWVGIITESNISQIAFSRYCPRMYCSLSTPLILNNSNGNVCLNHRDGMLCGNCMEGYSAVHGGRNCKVCDNRGLTALIANFSLGIILVMVIFGLKLTLDTGTIGGLIFYANIYGIVNTASLNQNYALPFEQFVQLLNVQQAFPICLYHGMHYYLNVVLHFVYSVYLWLIVLGVVLVAQCSTRVSRFIMKSSVQVLTTIIHLSFTKLLIASIDVFAFSTIQMENSTRVVWLYNGTIDYGTGLHIPLLLTASLFTVIVLIPYMAVAVCGWMCFRFSAINKFRPFLDTIYGPYQDKYRYWFGLRLILLIVVALLTASLRGPATFYQYLIQALLLTLFTVIQAYIRPFHKNWANLLDNWCMINVLLLFFINVYRIYGGDNFSILMFLALIVFFITVLAVLAYHIVMFAKSIKACLIQRCIGKRQCTNNRALWNQTNTTVIVTNQNESRKGYYSMEDSGSERKMFRESILEYIERDDEN